MCSALERGGRLPVQSGMRFRRPNVAAPSALIGASNLFELAVAVAIILFGYHSGAALATVVGRGSKCP